MYNMDIYRINSTVQSTVKGVQYLLQRISETAKLVCTYSTVVGKHSLSLISTISRYKYSSYVLYIKRYPHSAQTTKASGQFPERLSAFISRRILVRGKLRP